MTAVPLPQSFSAEEYLEHEKNAPVRHEFLAGQIYAMAGASETHNIIALNVAAEVRAQLLGGPCRVFISDMKVRVREADTFYYPDVFVTCDAEDREPYYKERPRVVIEVLSPGTEAVDRREKLLIYRKLASLDEYVLVSQTRQRIEVYRRDRHDGSWPVTVYGAGDRLRFESIDVELPVAAVYAGVLSST